MDLLIVNLVTLDQTFIDYYNFDSLLRFDYIFTSILNKKKLKEKYLKKLIKNLEMR